MIRSSLVVTAFTLLASIASLGVQLIAAHTFGAGTQMDSYLAAISLPFFALGLLVGAISYAVVPILVSRRNSDPLRYPIFAGNLVLTFFAVGSALVAIGFAASPFQIRTLAPSADHPAYLHNVLVARICWTTAGCTCLMSCLIAMHQSQRRFMLPAATGILPYAGMAILAFLRGHTDGTVALAAGMLAGTATATLVLLIALRRQFAFRLSWSGLRLDISPVLCALPLSILSVLCTQIFPTVDAYWASHLDPGTLSYLGYGQRAVISLGSLVAQGPLVVLAPFLSEVAATGNSLELRRRTMHLLKLLVLVSSPIALIVTMLRLQVVELLFQRGAFDAAATQGTAAVLPGLLLGMVAMVAVVFLLRSLHASTRLTSAATIGLTGSFVYFTLSGTLSKSIGVPGIPVAYALTWWSLLGLSLLVFLGSESRRLLSPSAAFFGLGICSALGLCALAVFACMKCLPAPSGHSGLPVRLLHLAITAGIGGSVYLLATVTLCNAAEFHGLLHRGCQSTVSAAARLQCRLLNSFTSRRNPYPMTEFDTPTR